MHKESLYQFILYTLLREGKSNLPFILESMLLGKQRAVRHWFQILFKGCDIPSFLHMKERFEQDFPQHAFEIKNSNLKTDANGLMTGEVKHHKTKRA